MKITQMILCISEKKILIKQAKEQASMNMKMTRLIDQVIITSDDDFREFLFLLE